MTDPTSDLPEVLRDKVRNILQTRVAGGRAKFKAKRDRSGLLGQREISFLLHQAGFSKFSQRWQAVINYGRDLYYGRAIASFITAPASAPASAMALGTVYSAGDSFRARAEVAQRQFRAEVLRTGWAQYGHCLDQQGVEQGMNFAHASARKAAEHRAAAGKGVNHQRTFGNMLSSQALCFNIFAPLAASPQGHAFAAQVLAKFVPGLARVSKIDIEYTPPFDVFQDQKGPTGVDCDVLIDFEDKRGQRGVLVLETKFVEPSFSCCGHRKKDKVNPCPSDVRLGNDFSGCPYVSKNHFLYWSRSAETHSLRLPLAAEQGCPFGGPLWQLWVNHTLAYVTAARHNATRAVFGVCAPAQNDELRALDAVMEFRQFVTDPSSVVFLPLEEVLTGLVTAAVKHATFQEWAHTLRKRYVVPTELVPERVTVTEGHRQGLAWMASKAFREIVAAHRSACQPRATIYFRPTHQGVVRIALHPKAPGYVGFRVAKDDRSYMLAVGSPVPTQTELRERLDAFERWLPTVRRTSEEEQGVMPWLRTAIEGNLWLPDLGQGWAFLHQEWRFIDDGGIGKKSDILAVHVPTGQLGIVEFKAQQSELPAAKAQVEEYAGFWNRDVMELAPFFTSLVRAMGAAYGNDAMSRGFVAPVPAKLFVGVASLPHGVSVWEA